jgi:phenylpropionate dioxygenase-like ring-hydroxylating dioxygenase large terminal subunit
MREHFILSAQPLECRRPRGLTGAKPIARTICDQAVVIFRGEDGEVGILGDRCPHRFAPLSTGEVCGNRGVARALLIWG